MSWTAFSSVLWILLCAKGLWCVRITELHIPDNVRVGDTINLTCQYDLEGEKRYIVKWYKDRREFYRFIPTDFTTKLFFPLRGIHLDLKQCDGTMVILKGVDKETSGEFKCEVATDAPKFEVATAWKYLRVEGVSCMRITEFHIPDKVRVGDSITLTCQHDLEGEKLYSVKWYKDEQEFYRFMPSDLPHEMFYPLIGIDVDLEHSDDTMVTLKEVDKITSGEFKCQVTAGVPNCEVATASDYLSVEDMDVSCSSHTIYGLLTFAVLLGMFIW